MTGGFRPSILVALTKQWTAALPLKTSAPAQQGGDASTRTTPVAVQNPAPLPHLQVVPGFRLRQSMQQVLEATDTPVPQTDDGYVFYLSYHLKGVCNSNYGGRHAHRTLSSHEQGVLSAWKSRYCAAQPPVAEIADPPWALRGGSVGNTTLSTRSRSSQGTHVTQICEMKTWYTPPPPKTTSTPDENLKVIN